ncbi:Receptor-type tyrosine-protein phosphatase mu [Triplophysa tibetana]|uniref:Receptor-type tyrosine-protein phosphatase mu n=1 Tax=Triplophysa tibetana TaxID=1572043 RepID=A0A5A9N519_9TELE|nr:Receptor-type tyrosine-protein phosphatase mu [Triplophysa tibetana]
MKRSSAADDCLSERSYSVCGYSQGKDDDLDWEQMNTRQKPSSDSWVPTDGGRKLLNAAGICETCPRPHACLIKALNTRGQFRAHAADSAFMMVNTSGRFSGQKTQLFVPQFKENDTHCVIFQYYGASREGSSPGQLLIYVKENNSPLGLPVWNTSGPALQKWQKVELAISTFWPNFYQGVEVNARQTAVFQCTINGQPPDHINYKLWLQGIGGREAHMKDTKPVNSRRYTGTFDIVNTTKGDSGRYRCIVRSDHGLGVSSYGTLVVKQPPVPIAPPQLTAVGATYLWIQLNANSINGDGPIIEKEVEYRTLSGSLIDNQPVDKANHKIGHLDPDTEYEISVLLTRPNEGGTGAPGPPLRARTKCADPMHGPRRLQVIDIKSKQFTVRWEPFGYNVTRCHNYSLTVEYRYTLNAKEETREEKCTDTLSISPQHTIRNLLPFTNVSIKLVLRNPEGVKESEELNVLTDEDVPGAVPLESIQGSTYEEKIALRWREPIQTYGIIKQYEIFYKAVSSFDPEFNLANQSGKVLKFSNETSHVFVGLYPGSTYSFTIRASTVKGYGPPVITQFTTKISRESSESDRQHRDSPAETGSEQRSTRQNASVLNSHYYFTAEFNAGRIQSPLPFTVGDNRTYDGYWNLPLLPHKSYSIYYQAVSTANGLRNLPVFVEECQMNALIGRCGRVYNRKDVVIDACVFATDEPAQIDAVNKKLVSLAGHRENPANITHIRQDQSIILTLNNSSAIKHIAACCLIKLAASWHIILFHSLPKECFYSRSAFSAATRKPDAVEPEKQTDHTVKIAGVIAGILLFVIIFLGVVLVMKKRVHLSVFHAVPLTTEDGIIDLICVIKALVSSDEIFRFSSPHSKRQRRNDPMTGKQR